MRVSVFDFAHVILPSRATNAKDFASELEPLFNNNERFLTEPAESNKNFMHNNADMSKSILKFIRNVTQYPPSESRSIFYGGGSAVPERSSAVG